MDYSTENVKVEASIFMAKMEKIEPEELCLSKEFKTIEILNENADYIIK